MRSRSVVAGDEIDPLRTAPLYRAGEATEELMGMDVDRTLASGGFKPICLPQREFALDSVLDDQLRASSGAMRREGDVAHPIFVFVAAIGGSGLTVGEMLQLCGCSIDDGPVLAGCELMLDRPMQVGLVYQVSGEITAMERKASRRFGEADHLLFRFALAAAGQSFARLELRMVVPVRRA